VFVCVFIEHDKNVLTEPNVASRPSSTEGVGGLELVQ